MSSQDRSCQVWTDQVKTDQVQNFFGPNIFRTLYFFGHKISTDTKFFGPKTYLNQIFFYFIFLVPQCFEPTIFGPKIFDQHFFWTKSFVQPNIVLNQNFFGPK